MDDTYGEIVAPTSARDCLLIADHFSNQRPLDVRLNAQIEVLVKDHGDKEEVWVLNLQNGHAKTFLFQGLGYWVREAIMTTQEQRDILCTIGFAAESGTFLKFLHQSSTVFTGVQMTHLLYLDEIQVR